jgi:hypothetical protein
VRPWRGYPADEHLAVPVADCAAWLSGQSSYRHSQLSPGQLDLLDALAGLGCATVRCGLPFNAAAQALPYSAEPLAAASARNAAQFLAARLDHRFQAELARHLQPLADRTSRRLVLLCGSCGMELLAAALPRLRLPWELRILAIALGPVGRRPAGQLQLHVIQGSGDWISRLGYRGPADLRVPGGHMAYLDRADVRGEVLRVAKEFLA